MKERIVSGPSAGTTSGAPPVDANNGLYGGAVYPGVLPAVPGGDQMPSVPDKDGRTNAATAASAASVRALSAQALQFYFRAPVKAFFRTRVDYLAYARGADGTLGSSPSPASATMTTTASLRRWLRGTTPGVLTLAIKRNGWSVVPDQILPPLIANVGVAAVLYTSYLQILARLHPESGQARRRVYPPPAPTETFIAGFCAGSLQSLLAAPLDAIQARYDHRAIPAEIPAGGNRGTAAAPPSMWAFSAAKLREIGLRGIFAGWGLSLVKDSFGNGVFFSVFEYVKAQCYYRFVARYYGALDGSAVLAKQLPQEAADRRRHERQQKVHEKLHGEKEAVVSGAIVGTTSSVQQQHVHHLHHHHDGIDSFTADGPDGLPSYGSAGLASATTPPPLVIRPHYALEPMFLLLAGVSASFSQQLLLHPLTHFQVVHWDLLEDLDAAIKPEPSRPAVASASPSRFGVSSLRAYYHAYQHTWRRCAAMAAAEGRSRLSWLYRGFWWNTIRQVPSTSAGLIIFELLRRKYGMAGEGVRIRQDGYDILLA